MPCPLITPPQGAVQSEVNFSRFPSLLPCIACVELLIRPLDRGLRQNQGRAGPFVGGIKQVLLVMAHNWVDYRFPLRGCQKHADCWSPVLRAALTD